MPKAGGLPDVVQKIGVDSSDAVTGYINVRDMAREASGANDMLNKSYIELTSRMRDMSAAAGRGIFQGELDSVKEYITQLAHVQNMYDDLAEASKRQIQVQQQQAKVAGQLFTDMAKQQQAAYSDMYKQAIADNKQFNAEQVAAAKATATQQKLAAIDALAAQKAAYTQVQANAISENRIMNQRIAAEKALQAEIQKTGDILDKRVISGRNIVPSVIAGRTVRDIGIDNATKTSRYADDVLMQRLIAGRDAANNAAIGYSATPVRDTANAFADAMAERLSSGRVGSLAATLGSFLGVRSPSGPATMLPVSADYGAYNPDAARTGAITSDAINAIRDSNKTYSILGTLAAAGGVSAIAGILSSPGMRGAVVDGAVAAAGAVATGARHLAVGGSYVGGALLGAGAAGLGVLAGGGNFDAGSATRQGQLVTQFLGTWLPRIHYGIMATNEILATAGPAAVAAVAAGAVGLEGGQTAYQRLSAINTVGQSLGPALGQTPGQFLGLGHTLQTAQTLADPGVWSLLGAAKSVATSGGGAFTQLGTNTIDMIDRFAAKITTAFTSGGAGKQMSDLVSQGTQYLQQFGDIAANIGTTFLHAAPVLPGVGGDLLSTLQGATRGLSNFTGWVNPNLLGAGLAAEAGARYGPAILGTAGNLLARAPGGIFGTTAKTATADEVLAGKATMVGETIGGTGLAGALGSTGALGLAGAAVTAYTIGKIITAKTPTQQWIGGLQDKANQDNLTQAYGQLMSNMTQFGGMSGGPQSVTGGNAMWHALSGKGYSNARDFFQGLASEFGFAGHQFAPNVRTPGGQANAALRDTAKQFNDLLSAGPAIQGMLGGGSLGNAYAIADMAGLQASQLGQLIHGTAKQKMDIRSQLVNEQAGYAAMASSPGVYGVNVQAVQAMGGLAGTKLSTVNQSWDSILSNATGGTASATGFAAGVGAISALGKAPGVAQALTTFSSPASQQAWAAFSSPSTTAPGALQQAQSMADWMRTAMTVSGGKIGQGQYNEVTAFQAKQLLPYAKSSPAALAQLGVLSQEMGGPAYDATKSQAQNYKAISKAIDGAAGSAKQYNKNVNDATIATAGVSQQALNFGSTMKTNVYAAMSGGATGLPQVSKDMQNFKNSFKDGIISTSALGNAKALAADFASVHASAKDVGAIIPQALQGHGLTSGQIATITEKVKADVSAAEASINSIKAKSITVKIAADASGVAKAKAEMAALKDKHVYAVVLANTAGAKAAAAAMAAVHDKTVYIHVIQDTVIISRAMSSATNPYPGGISGRMSTGGMVPGAGSGDHVPALLEPGEAIVPKYLVPLIAPILRSHHVPGFAAGGIVPAGTAAGIQAQLNAQYPTLDQLYASHATQAQISNFWKTVLDPLYAAKDKLTAATTGIAKTATVASKATADANKIATSINYARSVSNAAVSGLNIAGMSVDSPGSTGMGAVPPGHPGYNAAAWNAANTYAASNATPLPSVQDQMKSYLSSINAFSGDLGVLGKKGLNKGILQQLIGAGPVQGDALAQSILGGAGGVGGVNKLFQQIQAASRHLGGTAAGAIYGGHPTTSGGAVSVGGINISINVGGGGGSGGSPLTTAQIKVITEQVQAALLKQAKRNQKTGLKLPGYGA